MSNVLRKMFKTVPSLEEKGVVIEYGEGVEITVARAGGANKKFARMLTRLTKPHRRAIQTETVPEGVEKKIVMETYANSIVKSWQGITKDIITGDDADAEIQLECTAENIIAVFEALPDLFEDVAKCSQNISLFRAEILEADSGN